jgi:hypothetical protein
MLKLVLSGVAPSSPVPLGCLLGSFTDPLLSSLTGAGPVSESWIAQCSSPSGLFGFSGVSVSVDSYVDPGLQLSVEYGACVSVTPCFCFSMVSNFAVILFPFPQCRCRPCRACFPLACTPARLRHTPCTDPTSGPTACAPSLAALFLPSLCTCPPPWFGAFGQLRRPRSATLGCPLCRARGLQRLRTRRCRFLRPLPSRASRLVLPPPAIWCLWLFRARRSLRPPCPAASAPCPCLAAWCLPLRFPARPCL